MTALTESFSFQHPDGFNSSLALTFNVQRHFLFPGPGPVLCLTGQVVQVVVWGHIPQLQLQLQSGAPEPLLQMEQDVEDNRGLATHYSLQQSWRHLRCKESLKDYDNVHNKKTEIHHNTVLFLVLNISFKCDPDHVTRVCLLKDVRHIKGNKKCIVQYLRRNTDLAGFPQSVCPCDIITQYLYSIARQQFICAPPHYRHGLSCHLTQKCQVAPLLDLGVGMDNGDIRYSCKTMDREWVGKSMVWPGVLNVDNDV